MDALGGNAQIFPILGTMTFGEKGQVGPQDAGVILRSFAGTSVAKVPTRGAVMVDTARIYQQATPDGDTEATLGEIIASFPSLQGRTSIATKASAGVPPHFSLSRQSVVEQCDVSLEKLGLDCVDLFYLHWPDVNTDLQDTLEGVRQLHAEGKIREFGLSNYPAWMVVDIWHRCKALGILLPTVYQGMYNVITRSIEPEMVPVAREFGLRLYVYNPLAGGLLSGRYRQVEDLATATEGRFSALFDDAFGNGFKAGTVLYRNRYSRSPIFAGLDVLHRAVAGTEKGHEESSGSSTTIQETSSVVQGVRVNIRVEETECRSVTQAGNMANVSLRWLIHHSKLSRGDGVILGVSRREHLTSNLAAWQGGPLPAMLVEACEAAWEAARPACESYFRGLGSKPGGIEKFLALKEACQPEEQHEGGANGESVKRQRSA